MSKYNSTKTVVDGITFDSKLEARRYSELKMLEKAGEITELQLQPEYVLIPRFFKNGKTYRQTVYRADFAYKAQGKTIVEDAKGVEVPVFKLKRKLFEYLYQDLTLQIWKG